jgi:hypothetical protein
MVAVTAIPFAIALLLGLALFGVLTWFLIEEDAHHPVRFEPTLHPVHTGPRLSHARLAVICVLFALWSLWATARPVSGWR